MQDFGRLSRTAAALLVLSVVGCAQLANRKQVEATPDVLDSVSDGALGTAGRELVAERPVPVAAAARELDGGGWNPTSTDEPFPADERSIRAVGFSAPLNATASAPPGDDEMSDAAGAGGDVITMEEWFAGADADAAERPRDDWVATEKSSATVPPASEPDVDTLFELPSSPDHAESPSRASEVVVDAVAESVTTLADRSDDAIEPGSAEVRSVAFDAAPLPAPGVLPPPAEYAVPVPFAPHAPGVEYVEACQVVEPVFEQVVIAQADRCWCGPCSPWKKLFKFRPCDGSTDLGIGRKRLPYAPFEIESAQPGNNFTLRYDAAYGMDKPDRSEYFWAQQGDSPPLNELEVDYQQLRIIREAGSGRFSLTTEYPFRFLDPDANDNTAGLGDINIAPKIVLVDGKDWQLSHVFRTYIPTGSKRKGLGTGHASLEPGALLRYAWTEDTNLFGQLKFWFPIGGDPGHSGPVCVYGFGWATNLCDSDTYAMIGTIEMTGVSYLDGLATNSVGALVSNDSATSFNLQPGMRFVLGPAGDLGLFELGVSTGHAITINGQYKHQLRLDLRWSY